MAKSRTRLHAELTQQIDQNTITGEIIQITTTDDTAINNNLAVQNNLTAGSNASSTNEVGIGDGATNTIGGTNSTNSIGQGAGSTTNIGSGTGATTTNIGTGTGNDTLTIGSNTNDIMTVNSTVNLNSNDINIGNANTDDIDIIGDVDITGGSFTIANGVAFTIGSSGFTMDGQTITDLKQFTVSDQGGTPQLAGFLVSTSNALATP